MSEDSALIRVIKLLKPYRKKVIGLCTTIFFATALEISGPLITQNLIDQLISFFIKSTAPSFRLLFWAAAGIFFTAVTSRVFNTLYDYRIFKLVTSLEDDLRFKVTEKYLLLHTLFHHSSSSGQIIGRIERGATSVWTILYELLGHQLIPPITIFTGVLITLAFMNPLVALVLFIPLPVYIFSIKKITGRIYEIERRANDKFEHVAKESYDVAANVLTVKKFSQEKNESNNQRLLQAEARQVQYSAERLWSLIETIQTVIAAVGRVTVIFLAGWLVFTGKASIGEFVLFVTLQNMAYGPMAQLSVIMPRLRRNLTRVERLFAVMDESIKIVDKPNAEILPPLATAIQFKNISFSYSKEKSALKMINLRLPAKSTTALVGRSGSGKTTFINLLLRAFDPSAGSIMIDDFDLRDVTQESLRQQIAVVPQEVDLFSRTIAQNIAYGKPSATREQIIGAAKIALAHDFVSRLELAYDTMVGERGIKLSGGERQRIGIARAVLRNPKILILDEATSHLDTESEKLIQQATANLIKDRTTIIIAHRLSTVLHADQIVVFNNGIIEAVGKHAELLKLSPTYNKLYSLQFEDVGVNIIAKQFVHGVV